MKLSCLEKYAANEWHIPVQGMMRVPAIIYATEALMQAMDEKVYEQICHVASLPGIVQAAYAMPDAHWGYGFPIGGVAAFDPAEEGVISAGGVGFDISCGVRLLQTDLQRADIEAVKEKLADALYHGIPAGVGSKSTIRLEAQAMDHMLQDGARWAVQQGYGLAEDLERIEEGGCMAGAVPDAVSAHAKERQKAEMGTLGSGNHYLEVQEITEIFDSPICQTFGLRKSGIVISIHCGSRGLGHQIGTDYLREMLAATERHHIELPDPELACAPLRSSLGEMYLGAMRAGINCALANRQIIMHVTRDIFRRFFPQTKLELLYDVSHNTCKEESHVINGKKRRLFVHRKGATRAFGPHFPELPKMFSVTGQPVIIGGSMGTASYVLVGVDEAENKSLSSACHGAGRAMSRNAALKRWHGKTIMKQLAAQGIAIRSVSYREIAEEAPQAYKDVHAVVDAADAAGLAKKVARLTPIICIKG